jgi:hypothetical protein
MNMPPKILLAIKPRTIAIAIGLSFAICGTASTQAALILGARIFVQNSGDVIATFAGSDAGADNLLRLSSPTNNLDIIFRGHETPIGTTVDLGFFNAGTELIFQSTNTITGFTFFTGPAARNPDNIAHAKVNFQFAPGQTFVEFEDLFGGGDRDFNDITFTLSNAVPDGNVRSAVPDGGSTTAMLLGAALGMLGVARRFLPKRTYDR